MSSREKPKRPIELAYETPDNERASSASPTEQQLGRELPGGRDSHRRGHDPYSAFRYRDFRLYAPAIWMSVIGGQMQTVTVGWEIYQRTPHAAGARGAALNLGWLGLAMAAPVVLLALPAGHLADTHSRRRIMLATHALSAIVALALAALSWWWPNNPHGLFAIYALMIVGNAGATFGRPARSALMPQLVPVSVFPNAVTWNSTLFEIASVLGPAIGGLLCGVGISFAYLCTAACWLATMVFVYLLPNHRPPRASDRTRRSGDLIAGVKFVWQNKTLLGAMTLDMFAVLLGGCTFLLPIFAQKLGGGSIAYGLLRAAPSIGAIAMAVLIAHTPPFKRAGRALLFAVAAYGAVTIVFGLSTNLTLSFAMLILAGAFDNVSVVIRHTLIQLLTPDEMRGRVSAVNQVFIGSSNEIGGLESGISAWAFGEVASVAIGGIGTILVVGAVALVWPQVRKIAKLAEIGVSSGDSPAPQIHTAANPASPV